MNIDELVLKLAELYPGSFKSQATIDSWKGQYRSVLGHLDGGSLKLAFDECMMYHTKTAFPRPAEILEHCAKAGGKSVSTIDSSGARMDYVKENRQRFIDAWCADNPKPVKTAKKENWWFQLEYQLRKQADMVAQCDFLRHHGADMAPICIDMPRETLIAMRESYS